MKNILILFILFNGISAADDAKRELKNIHNDKYTQKYHYQNDNRAIVCESYRGRRAHCRIDTSNGVNLIRQLSNATCDYNWGYDAQGVWGDEWLFCGI